MPRNFDHRIEVACPIFDKDIQKVLWDVLQIQMRDNIKSRYLGPDNLNRHRTSEGNEIHRAQFEIYDYYRDKLQFQIL
jgi:polyphosphate kinase